MSISSVINSIINKYFSVWSAAKPITTNYSGPCITLAPDAGDMLSFNKLGFWDCNGPEHVIDLSRLYKELKCAALAAEHNDKLSADINEHKQNIISEQKARMRALEGKLEEETEADELKARVAHLEKELEDAQKTAEAYKKTAEFLAVQHTKAINLQEALVRKFEDNKK
jgi:FtsZ-binding cell division protein ZapB